MNSGLLKKLNPNTKLSLYMIYGLIALSILSCFSRPDYNIILGFLMLFLRSKINDRKSLKCGIHLILLSFIFDIIWIIKYSTFWRHGEDTSELWQSLSFTHNLTYLLGFLEMLLKLPLLLACFNKFTSLGQRNLADLLNFKYSI